MFRVFGTILNFFTLIILNVFQGGVSLDISAPTSVVAGEEITIDVKINKGDISNFSRLQQDIPAGLIASSVNSTNSDFQFETKRVRHIWMRMPDDESITVSYKIKVDERLKGDFAIKGKFSYIEDNERRSVTVESIPINITPSPNIDPSLIVDIDDFERLTVPLANPDLMDQQIACIRQLPINQNGEYIVNMLVSKERKERFAKVEEKIPQGYTAEVIDDHDAIFTFKNGKAKFLWMNLPASSFFTISYKLIPYNQYVKGMPQMDGKFSYLEEDKTRSIDVLQTQQEVAAVSSREELFALLASIGNEKAVEETLIAANEPTKTEVKVKTTQKATETKTKAKPLAKISTLFALRSNKKYVLEPENGVYYRVQLAAGHKQVVIKNYFKKYKLNKQVKIEKHEGWHKYSVGSFNIYKDARDYRILVWNTTDIDDAFVAAYNNGERITVQEALMITNHQWYK